MKKHRFDYFASCPTGLEEVLEAEILDLGAKTTKVVRAGVAFEAFHEVALRAVMESRVASRIFKLLYSFECLNEKDLYNELTQLKWKSLMEVHNTFKFTVIFGNLDRDRLEFKNSQFVGLKAKDAVCDWFRHYEGNRPNVDKDHPDYAYLLRIEALPDQNYEVTLLWDLAGFPLHERGYRSASVVAPMKENLAAGLLRLLNWDPEKEALVDPMCGSGTTVIEGALMSANIPPSFLLLKREPWSFKKSQWFLKDEFLVKNYADILADLKNRTKLGFEQIKNRHGWFFASDMDREVLDVFKTNVKTAGLEGVITFTQSDALNIARPDKKALFFYNPPYGERLENGEDEKLEKLYHDLGEKWKKEYKDMRVGFFTGNYPLLKKISLRTDKKNILYNGPIEARLAHYKLF
jgi:23S rRNA G2445 N2-methylase RlmL